MLESVRPQTHGTSSTDHSCAGRSLTAAATGGLYMRALGKLCSSSLPLRLSSEDRSVCSLARSAESVIACSTFSYSVTLCAGSEFRVRGETRPVGGRSLGAGVEARLLADCAACGAPPGLRTHAKGRALRRALSSILTGASPVALTPDGRAGRVLCEKQSADVWLMCVASQRRASAAQADDRLADRDCHRHAYARRPYISPKMSHAPCPLPCCLPCSARPCGAAWAACCLAIGAGACAQASPTSGAPRAGSCSSDSSRCERARPRGRAALQLPVRLGLVRVKVR